MKCTGHSTNNSDGIPHAYRYPSASYELVLHQSTLLLMLAAFVCESKQHAQHPKIHRSCKQRAPAYSCTYNSHHCCRARRLYSFPDNSMIYCIADQETSERHIWLFHFGLPPISICNLVESSNLDACDFTAAIGFFLVVFVGKRGQCSSQLDVRRTTWGNRTIMFTSVWTWVFSDKRLISFEISSKLIVFCRHSMCACVATLWISTSRWVFLSFGSVFYPVLCECGMPVGAKWSTPNAKQMLE